MAFEILKLTYFYLLYQVASWSIQPFGHNRHGLKTGGCVLFLGVGLGPHLTQCRLGRGLPPYQVASWSNHPFGHNRHGMKIGGCATLAMWPGPRHNSMPIFILVHPTIWPQYTNVTDRQTDRQWTDSTGRTVLQTVTQNTALQEIHLFQL